MALVSFMSFDCCLLYILLDLFLKVIVQIALLWKPLKMKRKEAEKLKKAYLEQKTNKINHKQHANRPNYRKDQAIYCCAIPRSDHFGAILSLLK